jgi:hypothetical protein
VGIVEKKMKYRLAQYQHERRKVADAKKFGSGADNVKVPKWVVHIFGQSTIQEKQKDQQFNLLLQNFCNWCPVWTL